MMFLRKFLRKGVGGRCRTRTCDHRRVKGNNCPETLNVFGGFLAAATFAQLACSPSSPTSPSVTQIPVVTAPDTRVLHGTLITSTLDGLPTFVVMPDGPLASGQRRPWIWFTPPQCFGPVVPGMDCTSYANAWLDQGIVIAAYGVTAYGAPAGIVAHQRFFDWMRTTYAVSTRARIYATSRGGLDAYVFAAAHPDEIERIGGIYPVLDWRDWPSGCWDVDAHAFRAGCPVTLFSQNVDVPLGFTPADFARLDALDPINLLAPVARAGIAAFHLHGDSDVAVHLEPNSGEMLRRYAAFGGSAQLEVVPGHGHDTAGFFKASMVAFLGGSQ